MAQLKKIKAVIEWRWSLEEKSRNGDEEEESEDGSRESQEKGTLLSTSYQISGFVFST